MDKRYRIVWIGGTLLVGVLLLWAGVIYEMAVYVADQVMKGELRPTLASQGFFVFGMAFLIAVLAFVYVPLCGVLLLGVIDGARWLFTRAAGWARHRRKDGEEGDGQ